MEKKYLKSYFLIKTGFLKEIEAFKSYLELLKSTQSADFEEVLKKYNSFLIALDRNDLSNIIKKEIVKLDYIEIENELEIIQDILDVDYEQFKKYLLKKYPRKFKDIILNLPKFNNSKFKITKEEFNFVCSRAYLFDGNLNLVPIQRNETISFYDLKGYEEQKRILKENTKALLNNQKVNNILLYGDAGCGKSSSVRALLNEFSQIQIVQIFKDNLINLSKLFLLLQKMPHKYIIFADDISFDEDDKELSTMKAILEGSLITCPNNAVIYATSNRRHLVKESFKARQGDEIHLNDTINEINSLSDRFGINLFFPKPTPKEFDEIVLQLAKDNGINDDDILIKAKRLALVKGSNSPRVARQLIESIKSNVELL